MIMSKPIISIDQARCIGCGLCVNACQQAALMASGKNLPFQTVTFSLDGRVLSCRLAIS